VRDARPERIREEVEGSLRRLRTDVIDLYYLHRIDDQVPFEDQWGAMAALVEAGTVRMLGLSEANVEELETASRIHPVAALQSELSLWTRDPIGGVLDWCSAHGVAFVPFSPLGRGYLTGSVTSAAFEPLDFRRTNPRFTQEALDANRVIVETARRVATRHGATPAQIAIAWCLAQGDHVLPIPGTRRLGTWRRTSRRSSIRLSPEDLAELDDAPAAVGSRY
jgi:aryl-alcohol dehydrogenase-like predicted oxidoreductase